MVTKEARRPEPRLKVIRDGAANGKHSKKRYQRLTMQLLADVGGFVGVRFARSGRAETTHPQPEAPQNPADKYGPVDATHNN